MINSADFSKPGPAAARVNTLATLKLNWPFRRQGAPGVSNYFFEDGLYPRPAVKRKTATIPSSHFEEFFKELDSWFSSLDRIERAEATIERLLTTLETMLTFNQQCGWTCLKASDRWA